MVSQADPRAFHGASKTRAFHVSLGDREPTGIRGDVQESQERDKKNEEAREAREREQQEQLQQEQMMREQQERIARESESIAADKAPGAQAGDQKTKPAATASLDSASRRPPATEGRKPEAKPQASSKQVPFHKRLRHLCALCAPLPSLERPSISA